MTRKTILMLMGKSGSGKSTLEKGLIKFYPGLFHKVVSLTTREQRDGEVDGVDYRFITREQFYIMHHANQLLQTTEFADTLYGSLESDYTTDHTYATLCVVPSSAKTLIEVLQKTHPDFNVKLVYFDISDERLRLNMAERGDSDEYINNRLSKDDLDKQFEESGLVADYVIKDEYLDKSIINRIASWLGESN